MQGIDKLCNASGITVVSQVFVFIILKFCLNVASKIFWNLAGRKTNLRRRQEWKELHSVSNRLTCVYLALFCIHLKGVTKFTQFVLKLVVQFKTPPYSHTINFRSPYVRIISVQVQRLDILLKKCSMLTGFHTFTFCCLGPKLNYTVYALLGRLCNALYRYFSVVAIFSNYSKFGWAGMLSASILNTINSLQYFFS